MLTFLIRFRKRLERVVKVSTEQPGFPFRFKLIRAFINFHALTMHIRDANVDRRIFIKGVSRTGAQPETVLPGIEIERFCAGTGLSSKAIPVRNVQLSS